MDFKQEVLSHYPSAECGFLNGKWCVLVSVDCDWGVQLAEATITAKKTPSEAWEMAYEAFCKKIDENPIRYGTLRHSIDKAMGHYNELRLSFVEAIFVTEWANKPKYMLMHMNHEQEAALYEILSKYD